MFKVFSIISDFKNYIYCESLENWRGKKKVRFGDVKQVRGGFFNNNIEN